MDKDQIRQVLIDQQSEFRERQINAKPRTQSAYMAQLVANSQLAKVVQGVRRGGKSTLCHQALLGREVIYVNFDDERLVGLSASDLQHVLELAKELRPDSQVYFFDEIQNIEKWELFVNRLQRTHHNLILSGSNGKLLGKDLATHLTGRQVTLMLHPLSFAEFVSWKDGVLSDHASADLATLTTSQQAHLNQLFGEYFEQGGFPEVVLGEPQGVYLRELFDKIIGRDVVQRYRIREVKKLKEVASYLLQNSAQFVSFENIKSAFGLSSVVTTQKYVQLLEDVFLLYQLRGYSYKLKERSTSHRKTYACDLGMIRALWTKPTLDIGAKFETLLFLHFLRREEEVYYLRQDAREVDFCLLRDGKPYQLVQACYSISDQRTREREIRALVDLGRKFSVPRLVVVTRDEESQLEKDGAVVEVIPVVKYLLGAGGAQKVI